MTCPEYWHQWNLVSTVQGKLGVITTEQCCRCLKMRSFEQWSASSTAPITQIEDEEAK